MHLPKNLKLLREYADKSQDAFGELFGLNRSNIASYERGTEPGLSFLIAVSKYFQIKLDDLVSCDLKSHMELLDTREPEVNPSSTSQYIKLQKEIEELRKDKTILAEQIALKDELIQRQWKEIDELKEKK